MNDETCCNNPDLIISSGQIVCRNCATVLGNELINQPIRAYSLEERLSKLTHEPLSNYGLNETIIDSRDFYKLKNKSRYYRLSKIQRSKNGIERKKMMMILKFNKIKKLYPPQIIEEAINLYQKISNNNLITTSIDERLCATIYLVSRTREDEILNKKLLTLDSFIEEMSNQGIVVTKKQMSRNISRLLLKPNSLSDYLRINYRLKPLNNQSINKTYYEILGLKPEEQIRTNELIKLAPTGNGKNYLGYLAAAIYLSIKNQPSSKKLTQKELANALGITEVTLRSRLKELKLIKPRNS